MKFLSEGLSGWRLFSIFIIAAMPLFLITALNILFLFGIPYNVQTYLAAFLLYYICRPTVVRPPDMQLVMSLGDASQHQQMIAKPQPKKSHLTVVRSDNDEPPKAS